MEEKQEYLHKLRHTAEHVLTQAMIRLYGKDKVIMAMGPATDEGFYFDFDVKDKFAVSEENFKEIEKEMRHIINQNLPVIRKEITVAEARELFKGNPYKQEWLDEIEKRGEKPTVYWTGDEFVDLCAGPHVEKTGDIKAVKLLSVAGAYWHGDEKNKMLTRIYGTAFDSDEELKDYLWKLEEAKKRDHRKLGKELELFLISEEVGPGLILWQPKGDIVKEEIEKWGKETEKAWGYQRVATPNITKSGLYYTSGHLPYYEKDMYPPMKLDDGEEYFLKPMNCPHHHMIYKARPRSYRELPLRLAEFGGCYRYESSGELFGLMRVRGFTQNDAHIYCTIEQAVDEFVSVMKLHEYYYKTLGITDYHLELALRDPKNTKKYHGNEEMWVLAEKLMRDAVKQVNIPMVVQVGNAAFYGPKIDFIIKSSIGREFAISTNQIDLFMGERFGLKYTDAEGVEKTPAIIHRAPLGSDERFIGFLIEHFGGAFPVWLSPVQAVVISISQDQSVAAKLVAEKLNEAGMRAELWDQAESMQKKIRTAEKQKIPYMLVVGQKEAEAGTVSVRARGQKDMGVMEIPAFVKHAGNVISTKSLEV